MDKQISHNVVRACKKLEIDYQSINPNYNTFYNDAQQLVQLYRDLKEISAQLQEISERHNLNGLDRLLKDDIEDLGKIAHDLVKLATKFKDENV